MIRRLLMLAAVAALALLLGFFALRSAMALHAPFQLEYGEGPVLDWTRRIAEGHLPYKPIAPPPWSFSVYTPTYLIASAGLLALLPAHPWLGGRLLSLLAALGLALLLLRIAPARARQVPLLSAALWLSSPYLFRWATFFRPDLFALFWSALGITLTWRADQRAQPRLLPWAALAFVVAFFSKQSAVAAPLAALIWLALHRREWLWRLLLPGVLAGLLVGGALWLASGGALLDNLIAANANAFSWQAVSHFYRAFLQTTPILVALALLGTFTARHDQSARLLALYALLALLVSLSIGKAGAWENYFLEPLWASGALATLAMARLLEGRGGWLVPLLVIGQLLLYLPGFERRSPSAELAWFREKQQESVELNQRLAALPADELIYSETMGPLADSGRTVWLHSFVYTQLERQGLWDVTPLATSLREGEAKLLIQRWDAGADPLGRDRWSRAMLDAGERGYALGERVGEWQLRPPLPFPQPDESRPLANGLSLLNVMVTSADNQPLADPTLLPLNQPLRLHLLLHSEQAIAQSLTASVQLFVPDGTRVAQDDLRVRGEWGLGGSWPAGALVRDEHLITLPDALPAGELTLLVALYDSESGAAWGSTVLDGWRVAGTGP